jgi:hypothetical protein
MKKYITKQSNIKGAGKGLFTNASFKKGEIIGLAHVDDQPASEIGRNHNHNEKNPTAYSKKIDNKRYIYASKDLKPGEEITTNYRMQPELEQPEDFMREGGGTRSDIPVIEDAGSYNKEGFWIPNWESMKAQAKELNAKTVKTKHGSMIYFDDNWNVQSVDDNPQMKRGGYTRGLIPMPKPSKKGLASKTYSRSLSATNKLFTQNFLFEKPKSRKNKVFDPNSKYYAEGGESGCPEGYIYYNGQCVEWQEPEVIETDENTGYNAATGEISRDTRPGSIENNDWWKEHEDFHHLQNLAGGMNTAGFLSQRPNNTAASDQAIDDYYNRRNAELEAQTDAMIKADPNLQFIPRNKLQDFTEGFPGANALMYQDPSTVEGEARVREEQFEEDGKSIFPKKQGGGLHKFVGGGLQDFSPCQPNEYWDGEKCVKRKINYYNADEDLTKNAEYQDWLIRQALWEYSDLPYNKQQDLSGKIIKQTKNYNNQQPYDFQTQISDFKKEYPETEDWKNDVNIGPYGSQAKFIESLTNDEVAKHSYRIIKDKNDMVNQDINKNIDSYKPFDKSNVFFNKYPPSSWSYRGMLTSDPIIEKFSGNWKGDDFVYKKPNTLPIEDNVDRAYLKKFYPKLTDEQINMMVKENQENPSYITNQKIKEQHIYIPGRVDGNDIGKGQAILKNEDGLTGYKADDINTYIRQSNNYTPSWPEPKEQWLKKEEKIENLPILKPSLITTKCKTNEYWNEELQECVEIDMTQFEDAKEPVEEENEIENEEEGVTQGYGNGQLKSGKYRSIDWNGIQIPYRLPKYKLSHGNYGQLKKLKGKQRYINLPKIRTRNKLTVSFKKQDGGNKDAMTGMMKARLAYANEFGNPAAERMINLPDNPYQFDNGDTGSHYMASMDNYAVPQIQDENGVLQLGDYGPESNEAIRFDSDEDANYFAEHYKDVSPGFIEADLDEDEIEEYRRGGYIVEEIDNYQDGGVYTVKGSDGVYKKVNGKWQVDWNRSGKYQPLSKGDVKARTAILDKMAKPVDDGMSKISSNSSDNTRVNNIYQKPLDWSFDPKYKNNIQAFVKKSSEEKEKAIQKEKEDSKIKKGFANHDGTVETVGQFNKRQNDWEHSNILNRLFTEEPENNYWFKPTSDNGPGEFITGIGGAPKMILQAGKWLKPLLTGTKNATQPFRQATVSALKAPLPLGRRITNATAGKLNLGNSVAAYFGADALYNQGDSKSDVVKSQSNFINNPSWNTLGDAAFETGVNSLGFSGLGLGKQVFKPTYNASKKLIKGFKGIPKQLSGSSNTPIVNTKMGFDFGMDMSKYEIKNPDYFTQLLNTYDSKALSTTNKKFYKDLIKSVKNQNNIATERQYGELQRLKTGNFNFGKKDYANGGTTNNYIELDLTPEEIQRYKNGGYIVEEINTYQNGGVNKKGKSYDYTRDPTYTERFKRFFGMEDVDDIAYEKVDDKNIKKYKQTIEPIKKTIRKIPTIENKSNFELDLKNRLQNIAKENILKEKNISKVEPIKNSLQITGNNNSNIKNKIVKPEDSFFESTYKKIKSFDNWLDNQKKLIDNGVNRKLQTWGIVETKDKKVIESPEPINVKDYYKNPTLSQTILNVNDQPNRQFKQQTVPTSNLILGSRNRGQYQDIESDGLEFTTFHPFSNAANIKPYNKKTNVNGINDDNSVFALDNKGVLHTGIYKNLKNNKDWKFSRTFMNKIVSIDDISLDGSRSGNHKFWQPQITILENNKLKKGALNILTKKGKAEEDYYGSILGGRVVFVNPLTKEQTLVSGSVSHIKKEFKRLKGNSKYLEAWSLDNGTYARGLSYKDGKLTKQRLVNYDSENTSGGNGLYIKKYNVPVNKFKENYVYDMPNVRTKKDDSYKAGHKLKNEIKNFVLHHTAYDNPITNEAEVKKQFMTPGQNSSHVVIEEDGSRTIYASPEQVSFHAGKSKWNGREDVNDFSIGVEFQGDTQKKPLTDQQVISFVEYYAPIAKKYNLNLKSIITHEQIRNAYIKKHANEKGLETKPDITYNQYKRILNYMKAKGIN